MKQSLYDFLGERGMLDYGSVIDSKLVRNFLGIEIPVFGTIQQFNAAALKELAAIDGLRDMLIDEGKYIQGDRGDYRILLPSENAKQAANMVASANRKLRKASKLKLNTPKEYIKQSNDCPEDIKIKSHRFI